jgi:hypothetical protein
VPCEQMTQGLGQWPASEDFNLLGDDFEALVESSRRFVVLDVWAKYFQERMDSLRQVSALFLDLFHPLHHPLAKYTDSTQVYKPRTSIVSVI